MGRTFGRDVGRKVGIVISAVVLVGSVYAMASGSDVLVRPLVAGGSFPYGTLITWAGLVSLPVLMHLGIRGMRGRGTRSRALVRTLIRIAIVLSLVWGVVGYGLAGNWNYVFETGDAFQGSNRAALWFWGYTALCLLWPMLTLILHILMGLWQQLGPGSRED